MKNHPGVESRESKVESKLNGRPLFLRPRPSTFPPSVALLRRRTADPRLAFTLIELLTVIAIMGVLASLILPVAGAVKKHQYIYNARAEMAALETAIDNYKAAYGFYPPDNRKNQLPPVPSRFLVNQLYYELTGTTNLDVGNPQYRSLNDPSIPELYGADVNTAFGVGGFMNCSKGGGEDAGGARNFLPRLSSKQVWRNYTNNNVPVTLLITSVGGPDVTYKPLGEQNLNPWRYNSSSPTNNPGSYDLWVQLVIRGKANLICNWNKQVQVNSPWP
jgi:prepilin-type N-terminal cleavage/methylation domain-containing protein